MKKTLIILLLLLGIGVIKTQAQSILPTDAYAYFVNTGGAFSGYFYVALPDSQIVNAIKIKLGTADGVADLADYTFAYDVTTGLPANYSYLRNNLICTLGVGIITEPATCFGEVQLQDGNGSWGTSIKFISN